MTFEAIKFLKMHESNGHNLVSWHTRPAWDLIKYKIKTDGDALKASKLLRDYSFYPLEYFYHLQEARCYLYLLSLLELRYADEATPS